MHGFRAIAHGRAQTVLVFLRIVDALAEDVSLAVIDFPARHAFHELEDWAVVMRVAARRCELIGDCLERRIEPDRLARAVGLVRDAAHQRDVEGQHRAFGEHDDGAARAHRVADAELVEHVRIGAGDVGHGVVAEH